MEYRVHETEKKGNWVSEGKKDCEEYATYRLLET